MQTRNTTVYSTSHSALERERQHGVQVASRSFELEFIGFFFGYLPRRRSAPVQVSIARNIAPCMLPHLDIEPALQREAQLPGGDSETVTYLYERRYLGIGVVEASGGERGRGNPRPRWHLQVTNASNKQGTHELRPAGWIVYFWGFIIHTIWSSCGIQVHSCCHMTRIQQVRIWG